MRHSVLVRKLEAAQSGENLFVSFCDGGTKYFLFFCEISRWLKRVDNS